MPQALRVSIGQHSLAGAKPVNQDFHGAVVPTGARLATQGVVLALADGISSSRVSQVASAAAVRSFLEDYYDTAETWTVRRAGQCVLEATNAWLHAQTRRSDARFDPDRGYVCTFSALILKGREGHLLHVGDSRIHRLHPQALEALTQDHRVRLSSAESHLARALGADASVEIDYRCWPLAEGEVYLLATDGAYEYLSAADVHAALARHPTDLDACAAALTATALARCSQDNITVQLVRVEALPPAEAQAAVEGQRSLPFPPPLQARMSFEGYTLLRELHASARSQVWLATDDASGQPVALKVPAQDLRSAPQAIDRFLLEEWVARRIDHPHVLKPAGGDRPRRHLFVVMEHIDGQTLAQWMRDHPRPSLAEVRPWVQQIAQALQAFHRKEMLHQDLRPENLMIDRTGTLKLIDFGSVHVAGLAEAGLSERDPALAGTLQYLAPEHFVGSPPGLASELFSLAVLTYQMLSGQLPYGLQVSRLRSPRDLAGLRYIPLRQHRPDLPAWLDTVLAKALHPQPARRHEALSEFTHALSAPDPRWAEPARIPLIERHPVRFWQTVSALLALAVLGLTAALLRGG
ncbi:protein kinase domain-containing protein [Ideonella dechloratans]|uniref:protein kinase domain-containing protein n=1 Tax=Ideonella dechloratans TaxID=36863 RepID=UPI0035B1E973